LVKKAESMLKNKAQSLTEYSICLAVVLIALITMNFYVKRGLQGRYRDLTDYTTAKALASKQYEPYYTDSEYTNKMGRTIIGTTIGVGSFKRDLPPTEKDESGNDKVNYMSVGGGAKKETEKTIKDALP